MDKKIFNYEISATFNFMVGADSYQDAEKEAEKVIAKLLFDPRVLGGPSGIGFDIKEVECLDDAEEDLPPAPSLAEIVEETPAATPQEGSPQDVE